MKFGKNCISTTLSNVCWTYATGKHVYFVNIKDHFFHPKETLEKLYKTLFQNRQQLFLSTRLIQKPTKLTTKNSFRSNPRYYDRPNALHTCPIRFCLQWLIVLFEIKKPIQAYILYTIYIYIRVYNIPSLSPHPNDSANARSRSPLFSFPTLLEINRGVVFGPVPWSD